MDKENGLCDNIIQAIIEDNHQNIYLTTSDGLSVLSVERVKEELSFSIQNFSINDGLKTTILINIPSVGFRMATFCLAVPIAIR